MCFGFLWVTFIHLKLHTQWVQRLPKWKKGGPSSSNSPLLSTSLLFYLSMWNELCNFFFSHLLMFLTCGFILLSVALFCAVTYQKKKERCFFYVKEQKDFLMCKIKGRVLKYKISRKKMFYLLPCQSDMQHFINLQRFFNCMCNC